MSSDTPRSYELWAMEAQARAQQCEDLLLSAQQGRDEAERLLAEAWDVLRALLDFYEDHGNSNCIPPELWTRVRNVPRGSSGRNLNDKEKA